MQEHLTARLLRTIAVLVLLLASVPQSRAYSVLTHEEVIDLVWTSNIVPLLKERFPDATDDDIRQAHAYAYGGSVIQDIGYYPFGSHYFSDLLHYVRTGDFVDALLADSTNINEYAFALGALAHYTGDIVGHPYVNEVTAREYPKLRKQYGPIVTYEEDPLAHLRTEFGFDVAQIGHSRFASQDYHNFIGFQVSKDLLNRAFQDTYGIPATDVLTHEDLAIATYRHSVSTTIPHMTRVALVAYGKQLKSEDHSFDRKKFVYRINKSQYRQDYGRGYQKPGIGARMLAVIIRIMPKVGPFRSLRLSLPTAQDEDLYFRSVNQTVDTYKGYLDQLRAPYIEAHGGLVLEDVDLDTGHPTACSEYGLSDKTHAKLLAQLTAPNAPGPVPDTLHKGLLTYFDTKTQPVVFTKHPEQWQQVGANLAILSGQCQPAPTLVH